MTETVIKARMMAEILAPDPETMDRVTGKLTELGFEIRPLTDWVDDEGSDTVWALAFFDSETNQDEFHSWVSGVVDELGGDVVEAGFSGSDADVEAWIARKS